MTIDHYSIIIEILIDIVSMESDGVRCSIMEYDMEYDGVRWNMLIWIIVMLYK